MSKPQLPETVTAVDEYLHGEALTAPHSKGFDPPNTLAPIGATDCHHHIFDPRYQKYGEIYVPPATVADYRLFKRRLGLSRSIVVAPSNYGSDNTCLIDALDQLGQARARGVAYVNPQVTERELDQMHARGVRGLRVYLAKNRVPSVDEMKVFGRRAANRGWALHIVGTRDHEVIAEWAPVLAELPCAVVIDHFGWAPQPRGLQSQTATTLFRLMDGGHTYVKLSGVYLSSVVGFPTYADIDELASQLVRAAPDRMIWGSDWPHPMAAAAGLEPDGACLFDQLASWAPDEGVRYRILVENPQRLYWNS